MPSISDDMAVSAGHERYCVRLGVWKRLQRRPHRASWQCLTRSPQPAL